MKTIGYHTCSKKGGKTEALKNAPYCSMYDVEKDSTPFLGTGYYFWDHQLEVAKDWGNKHYNKWYYIVECNLLLKKPYFFDLVGCMADLLYLKRLRKVINEEGYECTCLAEIIEACKEINEETPGFFDFKAIRAIDLSRSSYETMEFVNKSSRLTELSPVMIICLLLPTQNIISNKTIIFETR